MPLRKDLKHVRKILHENEDVNVGTFMIYLSDAHQLCTALMRGEKIRHHTFKRNIIDAVFMIDDNHRSVLVTLNIKGQFFAYRQWYYQLNICNGMQLPIFSEDRTKHRDLTLTGTSCDRLHLNVHEEAGVTTYHITENLVTLVDHLLM